MSAATRPLVFATRNLGKVEELRALLASHGVEVITVAEAETRLGITIDEVVEDGDTFAANAEKKAMAVARATGWPAIADDSGLEVDALGGKPGVHSARYAEVLTDHDNANLDKLLAALDGVAEPNRTARFRCSLAFRDPAGPDPLLAQNSEGSCEGVILTARRGAGGFGYDPVFLLPELNLTFGEMSMAQKNQRSHRAQAMQLLAAWLVLQGV